MPDLAQRLNAIGRLGPAAFDLSKKPFVGAENSLIRRGVAHEFCAPRVSRPRLRKLRRHERGCVFADRHPESPVVLVDNRMTDPGAAINGGVRGGAA